MGTIPMKKIIYITGTRADYGLMRKTLKTITENKELSLTIVATGMHLLKEFGETIGDIQHDNFKPIIIDEKQENDKKESTLFFLSAFTQELTHYAVKNKPDIILLLGDRAEMLAGALVGAYLDIPTVHLHGGEKSGHVDDTIRHTITKLCDLHLPATKNSAANIIAMGERKESIIVVGAPGIVGINEETMNKEELYQTLNIEPTQDYYLIVFHPVSTSTKIAGAQMETIITTLSKTGAQLIISYPNADAGGRAIIEVIKKYEQEEKIHSHKNMQRKLFLSAMKYSKAIIGNSSSGIIEAASFHTPVINIGERQHGRERSENIVDSACNEQDIILALKTIEEKNFKKKLATCINVYGDGKTDMRISDILFQTIIYKKNKQKEANP
jgi:UDP-hydrolysing UDP-N-acetyl-D-glucosamine 2-epimerase